MILKMMPRPICALSISSHFILKCLYSAFFALNVRLSNGGFDIKKKKEIRIWTLADIAWKDKGGTLKIEPLWQLSLNTLYSGQLFGDFLYLVTVQHIFMLFNIFL